MTLLTVRQEEDTFAGEDGTRLFERRWLPGGDARGHVAVVHGFAEHSGRYAHIGEALARRAYSVHALDLRGHGRSEGPCANVRSFGEYLTDVRAFHSRVREYAGASPVFLLGHSMGATIVTLYLIVDGSNLSGAMLSGGVLTMAGTSRLVEAIIGVIARIAPGLPLTKLKASDVSRDPAVVQRYEDDPMVYRGRVRAGMAAAMMRAVRRIERDEDAIHLPLLIMHGTADALARPDGSSALYERAPSADKTLKLYDGLYHEIFNEPEKDRVIDDVATWLDARTAVARAAS